MEFTLNKQKEAANRAIKALEYENEELMLNLKTENRRTEELEHEKKSKKHEERNNILRDI